MAKLEFAVDSSRDLVIVANLTSAFAPSKSVGLSYENENDCASEAPRLQFEMNPIDISSSVRPQSWTIPGMLIIRRARAMKND